MGMRLREFVVSGGVALALAGCNQPASGPPPLTDATTITYSQYVLGSQAVSLSLQLTLAQHDGGWEITQTGDKRERTVASFDANLRDAVGHPALVAGYAPLWIPASQRRAGSRITWYTESGQKESVRVQGTKNWKAWHAASASRAIDARTTAQYYYDLDTGFLASAEIQSKGNRFVSDPRFNGARLGVILVGTNLDGLAVADGGVGYFDK